MQRRPTDRLDSWKEIAAFLGGGERSARCWAKFLGSPFHHAPGGGQAGVYARRSEILSWMARNSSHPITLIQPSVSLPLRRPLFLPPVARYAVAFPRILPSSTPWPAPLV